MAGAETLVREFCAAWFRKDADELTDYFDEDAVYHNMPVAPLNGKDAIRAFLTGFLSACDNAEFTFRHVVADGDLVMTERVDSFKMGERAIAVPVMGVFEICDGKISAWRDYFDMAQVTAFLSGS